VPGVRPAYNPFGPLESQIRCFAADPGTRRVREVRLEEVIDLLPLTHNESAVERYREAMLAGTRFPPIGVLPLFGRLVITDGHKRFQAAKPIATGPVPVDVWTWRRLAADQWRQARANAGKNARIVRQLFVDPRESFHLARATALHWGRVARCLLVLVAPRSVKR
jgi:hypothetical protein